MQILKVENVSYSYDKVNMAVNNVSFSINEGEYVAIIGHNGSGKSTIAKLLNALLKPDQGTVTVDGLLSSDKKSLFDIRKTVGVVFQNPDNQLVASIVEDDVAFGPENLGVPREEIKGRIDFALSAVGMQEFRHSSPTRLSGGQKQRIAIAGVLALKPKILVLDESTAMLDPKGRKEVLEVVDKLRKEQGVTVLSITHYMEEVVDCDRVLVMDKGSLVMQGTPEQIFNREDELVGLGLELPPAKRIADELIRRGVPLPDGILTEKRLGEELCKL